MTRSASTALERGTSLNALLVTGSIRLFEGEKIIVQTLE